MAEVANKIVNGTPKYLWGLAIFSIILIIVSFAMPPAGVIDASVIKSIGYLFGGSSLFQFVYSLPTILHGSDKSVKASVKVGNMEGTVEAGKEE